MGISGQNLRATAETDRKWIRRAGMLSHSGDLRCGIPVVLGQ